MAMAKNRPNKIATLVEKIYSQETDKVIIFIKVKAKVPHTRYEHRGRSWSGSLGSQPAGDVVINPVVGCHYFPPRPLLPPQPKSVTAL